MLKASTGRPTVGATDKSIPMSTDMIYPIALMAHVLAAILWIGGIFFMGLIAVPVAKRLPERARRELLDAVGRKFRSVGWSALAALVLSGGYLMWHWGATVSNLVDGSFFSHDHGQLLGIKVLGVGAMLIVSAVHDFWLGPRATREGRSEARRMADRRLASWLGRITGILAIGIVVIAVFVARPWI